MHTLNILVPSMLEAAIDYPGKAQYVAFFWSPEHDEARYFDGQSTGNGWDEAYLIYTRHPRVYPLVAAHQLGASEDWATECLILDRFRRRIFVAPPDEAEAFLWE
jgi:hypothetical protein